MLSRGLNFTPTPPKKTLTSSIAPAFDLFRTSLARAEYFKHAKKPKPKPNHRKANRCIEGIDWTPRASYALNTYITHTQSRLYRYVNFYNNYHTRHTNHSYADRIGLRSLCLNKQVRVLAADKNLGPVIVDSSWAKSQTLIHLHQAFKPISPMGIVNIHRHVSDFTHTHLLTFTSGHSELPTTNREFFLKPLSNYTIPCLYLLAKIHKHPMASRPITPHSNSMIRALSIWVDTILQPIVARLPTVVKDTKSLILFVEQARLISSDRLLVFDVKALYPSIPIGEGISKVRDYLFEEKSLSPKHITLVLETLKLILTSNVIRTSQYTDRYWLQYKGTAMGTQTAPAYANLFMYMLERDVINKYKSNNTLSWYKRYIDDVLILCNETVTESIFNDLNDLNDNIIFTGDTKGAESVNFLDLVVTVDRTTHPNTLYTKVYQKDLNLYLYLDPKSCHPKSVFFAFVKGELIRYIRCCTHKSDFVNIAKRFIHRLRARGYPINLIKKCLAQVSHKMRPSYLKNKKRTELNNNQLLILPFTGKKVPTRLLKNVDQKLSFINPMIVYRKTPSVLDMIRKEYRKQAPYIPYTTFIKRPPPEMEGNRPQKRLCGYQQRNRQSRSIQNRPKRRSETKAIPTHTVSKRNKISSD